MTRSASPSWRKSSISADHGADCIEAGSWRKSQRSNSQGACVETGYGPGIVGVRDTKEHGRSDRTVLEFTPAQWAAFTASLK